MRRLILTILLAGLTLGGTGGCLTSLVLKGVDAISGKAAKEEDPIQEAREGPIEHGVEEAGKATQKGVREVEKAKKKVIEKAKDVVD